MSSGGTAPTWLSLSDAEWPEQRSLLQSTDHTEEKGVCLHTSTVDATESALPMAASFTKLKRVTAWISRFIGNLKLLRDSGILKSGPLSVDELLRAEDYWFLVVQRCHFPKEISSLRGKQGLRKKGPLTPLHPFLDERGFL